MGAVDLDQIHVTKLKRIPVVGGDVLHALKATEEDYRGFGEAYFSMVNAGAVKAWKMHRRMTLNLVAPIGEVRFVFFSADGNTQREITIGAANYARLTVPPGIWFGFQGLAVPYSVVLNVADMPHDPDEVVRKSVEEFTCDWKRPN
ncbi:MAG: dTDP-4-dehydrorhamnose 3,5-epimerase [Betaproteobacteria bacterium]|nr:dTDP-4-dehydrorhamnose 3,5-epimerase [Betaproteobacteria bacterium]